MDGQRWLAGAVAVALLGLPALAQEAEERERADMRGLTVMVGGGVEGYTGDLSPQLNPGPAWSVTAAFKPTRMVGIELGYSGAVNEIDNGRGEGLGPGATSGADIMRNGGSAVATLGLSPTRVQPYLLAGVGIDRYNVRGGQDEGFSSDTLAHVPLGAGLRTHVGNFTADARFGYSLMFDQDFASVVKDRDVLGVDSTSGGRYLGTINLGATF
ncbi:MAG: outer membrane beta-barrel protein [Myxococcales bacterium]|nr:outer membrane beta-barrel protein [Myxococcales bacterium]